MDETRADLMAIGDFSRATGLSVSTLRFYAESDLLRPAWVNPDSGYRYYEPDQLRQARLIGRLRAVDIPLPVVAEILGDPSSPRSSELIDSHWVSLEARMARAKAVLVSIHALINEQESVTMTMTTVDSAELKAACQQVQWAIYAGADAPPISGVLFALEDSVLRLAATNRSALAVANVPARGSGEGMGVTASGDLVRTLAIELPNEGSASVELGTDRVTVTSGGQEWSGAPLPADFPDYAPLVPSAATWEAVVESDNLSAALERLNNERFIRMTVSSDGLKVASTGGEDREQIEATVKGEGALSIGFDPALLAAAARSVGGQLQIWFGGPTAPVLLDAEGSSFAVVMPVRLG